MCMLLGVLVLVVARGERKSLALRLWGWGLVVYALGMLTIISVAWLPLATASSPCRRCSPLAACSCTCRSAPASSLWQLAWA